MLRLPAWLGPCVIGASLLAACGPSEPAPLVGVSRLSGAPPGVGASSASSGPARRGPPWPYLAASAKWAKASGHPFLSQGHLFGKYQAEIVVNEAAATPYAALGPGGALPAGAVVAEVLTLDGAKGPTFAMERGEGGWSFVEIGADGAELRRGRLEPCVSCHAGMASQDELFGAPSNAR
jgi:hypothetical protein